MTFNGDNTFTWPAADVTSSLVGTTQSFTVTLSDSIGNSPTITVFVAVAATSGISVFSPPASVVIGSPVLVAFNDASPSSTYTVTSSDPGQLAATLMQENNQTANPVLQIVTNVGNMDLELLGNYAPNTVAHIVSLVNSGDYASSFVLPDHPEFHDPGRHRAARASTIPVELNADLRFTSSGLLAMANNGVDGNSSEFFITGPDDVSNGSNTDLSDGFLDFRYTIFGKLIEGDNVRQALAATQVGPNSSGETASPSWRRRSSR